jgi:hypothetical protein
MGGALDFFVNIPDDILIKIVEEDWDALKRLCVALTIDMQLIEESSYEGISNRRNLC